MPNTKEKGKLIEVLGKHLLYGYATLCLIADELMADELMADGVTVQENCKACAEATQNCIVNLQEQIAELHSVQGDKDINVPTKWISVKERLPEHGDAVLCFMKFGEHRILQWDNVSSWWLGYGHGDDWQKANVTHWCCLPQPPKGE